MTRSEPTRRFLTEWESRTLLALPGPAQALTSSVEEAADFAARHERVVAKVSGVAHKTEINGVRLDQSVAGVRACWAELAALGDGTVILAEQITGSHELIIGAIHDPQFGPVLTIGIGGELAELLDDAVALLAPIEDGELEYAISTLRTAPLFHGYRGHPAIDLVAIRAILDRLSAVLEADPTIVEIDCNPVLVRDGKPYVLDALVVVEAGWA